MKDNLEYTIRNDLFLDIDDCEYVWLEFKLNNKKFIVSTIYRHPRYNISAFQNAFLKSIEIINKNKINHYIFGDINVNLLRYNENDQIRCYLNQLQSVNCHNLIDKPTRVTMSSTTLIDHIYTNDLINKTSTKDHSIVTGNDDLHDKISRIISRIYLKETL